MDFDVIFPIQLSEFIISLNFGRTLKKNNAKIKQKDLIFHLRIDFYR